MPIVIDGFNVVGWGSLLQHLMNQLSQVRDRFNVKKDEHV
jgi:hypothetical protein